MNDSPWSKKNLNINIIALISLITVGTIIIIWRSTYPVIYLPLYFLAWIFYYTVGGYYTCRHCDFLGKPCPSWNKGVLAGKLYKRTDKKTFMEIPRWQFILLNIFPLVLALFSPYIPFAIIFLDPLRSMSLVDNILLPLYAALEIAVIALHSMGCRKCTISECPLSKAGKN
jgi:hypothetical protein